MNITVCINIINNNTFDTYSLLGNTSQRITVVDEDSVVQDLIVVVKDSEYTKKCQNILTFIMDCI